MSLVLGALDSAAEVADVLDAVQRQTIRHDLELVVVCDTFERLSDHEGIVRRSADRLIEGRTNALHEARAIAVRAATAPFVAVLEDHCCPEPEWAAALADRLTSGDWAAVGPAFLPANPPSGISQAIHLICYGQWLAPTTSREMTVIAGHNGAYRRDVLLGRADLARDLAIPVAMQRDVSARGHRFYLEANARVRHWDASEWRGARQMLRSLGHALGFRRAADRHFATRLAMALTLPALVAVRWTRSVLAWRRGRRPHHFLWRTPIYQLALTIVWSSAECWAYVFAKDDGLSALSDIEHHRRRFMRPGEWPQRTATARV